MPKGFIGPLPKGSMILAKRIHRTLAKRVNDPCQKDLEAFGKKALYLDKRTAKTLAKRVKFQ